MKEGPNIAIIAALVGDPARANMLNALLGGAALTASELAAEAGVTLQTASSHLSKLQQALPDRAGAAGPPPLFPPDRQRRRRRARRARHARCPRRPPARAAGPEGSGDAARAHVLRPPRRRVRRAHVRLARQPQDAARRQGRGRDHAARHEIRRRVRRRSRKPCRPRAVRSARNASTGANDAAISQARSALPCSIACTT